MKSLVQYLNESSKTVYSRSQVQTFFGQTIQIFTKDRKINKFVGDLVYENIDHKKLERSWIVAEKTSDFPDSIRNYVIKTILTLSKNLNMEPNIQKHVDESGIFVSEYKFLYKN